ncbi:hypothetical protein CYMTET_31266 [Cymbomonas tetramitiformis]|uniref:Uncharacterized protein n=1 Tax=Cymbomonas tetramitiformis TaxID=36881 RepID=A0AAE0FHD1_9CHLO|nr:hypothetical protein CYMTET_31266 [Cymbomonas tetramitiformis]|eukprot:gene9927-11755_t
MTGSTLVAETDPEPGHILSMHGMTAPSGVCDDDKDIHVINSDDESSDGHHEIDTDNYGPRPHVHPCYESTGGAGLLGTLLIRVICLSMFLACATDGYTAVCRADSPRRFRGGAYGSVVLPQRLLSEAVIYS